jgi:Fur family ferric uptake transcriptional regulator
MHSNHHAHDRPDTDDRPTKKVLAEHGLRATMQRIKALDVMRKAAAPLSAEDVHAKLRRTIDLATVYRLLKSAAAAGILREAPLGDETARYEWAGCHHHHVVCTECRDSEPVHVCLPQRAFDQALLEASRFSDITGHAIQIFGLCRRCAAAA